jgi:hypothetical protein
MKRLVVVLISLFSTIILFAQKDPVSTIFEKYSGKEGFITVNMTGDMLGLMMKMEEEKRDTTFRSKLTMITILTTEKGHDSPAGAVDFKAEVYDKIDRSVYKEMMTIKESDEEVAIMLQESKGQISELLVIVGGQKENALIQVKGSIILGEIADIAGKSQMKGFEYLRKLEK